MQEREASSREESFIQHKHPEAEKFVINMSSLHNAHLVRRILPRTLVAPVLLYSNRQLKHAEQAERLRDQNTKKRAAAAQKRQTNQAHPATSTDGTRRKKRKSKNPTTSGPSATSATEPGLEPTSNEDAATDDEEMSSEEENVDYEALDVPARVQDDLTENLEEEPAESADEASQELIRKRKRMS